jgi:pantoate--beta-alanine ligase
MKIIKSIEALRDALNQCRGRQETIGLVPTMGYLHEGHLSLVKASKAGNDITVVSIFVNPTQFGPSEDLESYPRDMDRDGALLEGLGVDFVFNPDVEEMYPKGYGTFVNIETDLTKGLCGAKRPGHFKGVGSVVTKLFNIVNPNRAYFGQKDAQQVAVIKRIVQDLNMDLEIIAVPIVREEDGLALSSRNIYLKGSLRKDALVLSKALEKAQSMIKLDKIKKADNIVSAMKEIVESVESSKIDYIEIVGNQNLRPLVTVEGEVLIAMAVFIGTTRLIDNVVVEV